MLSSPDTLLAEGHQARGDRRLGDAKELFAKAEVACRKANDQARLAQALTGLGQIERDLHHTDAALKHYREAVALYRTLDEPLKLAHAVRHAADILQDQRRLELAAASYEEALSLYQDNLDTPPLEMANALRGLAKLKSSIGETDEATFLWRGARNLYQDAGVEAGVKESESHIAFLLGQ
jgi:tetratricopeptide (TPR) repeat protein